MKIGDRRQEPVSPHFHEKRREKILIFTPLTSYLKKIGTDSEKARRGERKREKRERKREEEREETRKMGQT